MDCKSLVLLLQLEIGKCNQLAESCERGYSEWQFSMLDDGAKERLGKCVGNGKTVSLPQERTGVRERLGC